MTQADVSGLCKNMVSQRTGRNTVENDAPHIRLDDDADLKVWRASVHESTTVLCFALGPPLNKSHSHTGELYSTASAPEEDQTSCCCCIAPLHWGFLLLPLPNPKQPVLSLACTQIMIKLIRPEIERTAAAT